MQVPQHRSVVMAPNGVVATGHHLASAAGLEVLLGGGNAIDAALAAAGVMGVVQPMMSGLGGDTFLLYYERASGRVWAVNGSGPAPRRLTLDYLAEHHGGALPGRGMLSAGVPGAVDVMCTALERWGSGRYDLPRLLAPAIRYAEGGYPAGEMVSTVWEQTRDVLARFETSRRDLLPGGQAPAPGDRIAVPAYGASLRKVAAGGRDAFYRGEIAARIAQYGRDHGGLIGEDDLADYRCEVYDPIATTYHGVTVYSTAPPSQGAILLELLNLAEADGAASRPWGDPLTIHRRVEAKKLAFADRNAYLADPLFCDNPLDTLISKEWALRRRAAIRDDRAQPTVPPGALPERVGDTTYLCAADRDGNMVSLITSLSAAFGSGEVVGDTGICLNNRVGRGFTIDPASPNVLAPGKRTMHTLLCYLALRDGAPYLVGGTPGGDAQPQINLQVLSNLIDFGLNPQQAVEAPRWVSFPGSDPASLPQPFDLRLEDGFPAETHDALKRLGHVVRRWPSLTGMGAQLVVADPDRGAYHAGSDPRVDGCAIGH